jgi:TonB family protein
VKTPFVLATAALSVVLTGSVATAQPTPPIQGLATAFSIERVRSLYSAAAYEEALAAMPVVDADPVKTDVEQYRALCFLALGREQDAVATVERLVRDNPLYLPQPTETSPRMRAIFASARSRVVPDAAKRAYAEAKAAYESKDRDLAHTTFKRAIELIDSLPDAEKRSLSDLRLLAGEFLELSTPAPAPPAAATTLPLTPAAKPEPSGPFIGPVAIREQLPDWIPPDAAARRSEYTGVVRIVIDAEGKVTSATVVKPSHPAFDAVVVAAAAKWRYKPATRGNQPVTSTKDLQIRLVPR